LVPPKVSETDNVNKSTLLTVILTIGGLISASVGPVLAEGKDGDPDAIGHSADGFYLDFSPVGKVELPRIFVVRDASGSLDVDFFITTHAALEHSGDREYGLQTGPASDPTLLTDQQVIDVISGHTHVYFPVVPKGEGEQLVVDLSITRQMVFVLLSALILLMLGLSTAGRYKKGIGRDSAPRGGFQNAMEALIMFIRDDVAIATIGKEKYAKYLPYLLSVFIFILLGNLLGLLPWGVTATSGISVTGALAMITFFVTNLSGSKDYWKHVFNPPGVPGFVKPIIVPVEILGLFTKPITLAVRLFANMLSGHLVIVSLLGLIFIFTAKVGTAAGIGSIFVAVPMTIFIYVLKILVSTIQAYIFTMLSALYIGLAVEEHSHEHHHEDEAHDPALA
jgi:F-type H+-transporting ATPase subunit a